MLLRFKCALCRKDIDFDAGEVYYMPGRSVSDVYTGLVYNTGKNYCLECYEELTRPREKYPIERTSPSGEEASSIKEVTRPLDRIRDIFPKKNLTLIVEVKRKGEVRTVSKDDYHLHMCDIEVEDETGKAKLVLWQDVINKVKVGDKILIKNGYVTTFRGENKLTLGKKGELSIFTEEVKGF